MPAAGDSHWPPLLIRADGGPSLGLGHVLRSLALGERWRRRGGRVELLGNVVGSDVRGRLDAAGIPLREMHVEPGSDDDWRATLAALEGLKDSMAAPWLLLDGYSFGPEYQRAASDAGVMTLMLDDTAHQPAYLADIVLNQNLGAEALVYRAEPETVILAGSRFILLRQEFLDHDASMRERRPIAPVARRIVVSMGGSDPVNATVLVLEALQRMQLEGLEVLVVVGPANPFRDELQEWASRARMTVRLLHSPEKLPELMTGADLVVSAAGSTCWELAYLGVPMVVVPIAENQAGVARALADTDAAVNAGWHEVVEIDVLAGIIRDLSLDAPRREALRTRAGALVDGGGADRVLSVVAALSAPRGEPLAVEIRRARWEDRFQLLRLANDPLSRASSFGRSEIQLEQHLRWYREKLDDADTLLLVMDVGGVVAAHVRYDRTDADTAEVHFAVAAPFRGRGLGTRSLRESWSHACELLGVQRITGVVLQANEPSARAFRSAGYRLSREAEMRGVPCFVFELSCKSS